MVETLAGRNLRRQPKIPLPRRKNIDAKDIQTAKDILTLSQPETRVKVSIWIDTTLQSDKSDKGRDKTNAKYMLRAFAIAKGQLFSENGELEKDE